jgi:membrane dipeptidase
MKKILVLLFIPLLINACGDTEEKLIAKAKKIHEKAYTVDSHVDTPMWFTRDGFDYGERHDRDSHRSKLDLPRMIQGGLDGVFFAVFVGQGSRDSVGNARAMAEANLVIDSINSMLEQYPDEMELAVNSGDLKRISDEGKRAIFLGMENGYPLGNDLSLIDKYYADGVRYITLVHTRTNDICDSSNDSLEHNGVTVFGKEVIAKMNDLGIMIDVSHASDKSFEDIIELSTAPVIASHSCSRAMCDNPRNLTDEMLLQLKDNGGVIQMCILSDYVKDPGPNPARDSAKKLVYATHGNYYELDEAGKSAFLVDWFQVDVDFPAILATVSDVVDHIDHIVEVVGIDHVGIGTDFDGGGGVADCFDVSEMGNITLELVRRGYSKKEIFKIWGGNLMRVMEEVEG